MSSTRRSSDGEFHQERYCSSPDLVGDTINGFAAAKRIALVKEPATRAILWWLQWLSLTPGKLQELCDELIATFPERIGTPTLRTLKSHRDRKLTRSEGEKIQRECRPKEFIAVEFEDWSDDPFGLREECTSGPQMLSISEVCQAVALKLQGLPDFLTRCCLDPETSLSEGFPFFEEILEALTILRDRSVAAARARLADTAITRKINETLDFGYARRRMVLIEGVAGIGRSESAKAWCDAHAGTSRYVEIPSSGDDRSFYSAVARALGIARGFAYNPQQIKLRVEDTLAASRLMLVLDEAQFAWPQVQRPRGVPPRMLWIKSLLDAGTAIALIALDDFSRWQELYVSKTFWTDSQFERRLNRRVMLPAEHSREDMLKIARVHFPAGGSRSWKLLAAYALGTEKKQASGIVEALESARHRAEVEGRGEPTFEDIEAVLTHVHGFLSVKGDDVLRPPDKDDAEALHKRCNRPAKPLRSAAGESEFPISVGPSADRIVTPRVAV